MLWTQHANDLSSDLGLTLTLQARSLQMGLSLVKSLNDTDAAVVVNSISGKCLILGG